MGAGTSDEAMKFAVGLRGGGVLGVVLFGTWALEACRVTTAAEGRPLPAFLGLAETLLTSLDQYSASIRTPSGRLQVVISVCLQWLLIFRADC